MQRLTGSPYYYIQMDDARTYMHNLAGFGHHQVLIFGDYLKQIKKIAKDYGIPGSGGIKRHDLFKSGRNHLPEAAVCVRCIHCRLSTHPPAGQYRSSSGGKDTKEACRKSLGKLLGIQETDRIFSLPEQQILPTP